MPNRDGTGPYPGVGFRRTGMGMRGGLRQYGDGFRNPWPCARWTYMGNNTDALKNYKSRLEKELNYINQTIQEQSVEL